MQQSITSIQQNMTNQQNIQYGFSGIAQTGTITFNKLFISPPMVFTQIIGNKTISDMGYLINVYNVTNHSFNYSKYKIVSQKNDQFNIMSFEDSLDLPFNWMAIGK